MNFKIITLIILTIILILGLVYVYYSIQGKIGDSKWPPKPSLCPDYWIEEEDKDGKSMCINEKEIGLYIPECQNNLDSKFLAKDNCAKSKWARTCDLTWDGVSNKKDVCSSVQVI